ncbi:hypothetical protein [Nocardia callitridis]
MNDIEYVFGTGDGHVHTWTGAADLELATPGIADALQLDFDGDGSADDALWDSGGTGIANVAALDLDDDGVLDHFFTDPSGLGTWDHQITGSPTDAGDERLAWIVRSDSEQPDAALPADSCADPAAPAADSGAAPEHSIPHSDLPDYLANALTRDARRFDEGAIAAGVARAHDLSGSSGAEW